MDVELFNYELPPELIAQTPAARREESRLLVVNRRTGTFSHHIFADLPNLIPAGTRLFSDRRDAKFLVDIANTQAIPNGKMTGTRYLKKRRNIITADNSPTDIME